jgi:hypothetical protein
MKLDKTTETIKKIMIIMMIIIIATWTLDSGNSRAAGSYLIRRYS